MNKPLSALQIARLFHISVKDAQALVQRAVEVRMGDKPVPVQKRVKKVLKQPDFAVKFGGVKNLRTYSGKTVKKALKSWENIRERDF